MIRTEDGAVLLQLLNRLVVALQPPHIGGARRGTALRRWEDKEYLYVEANLADEAESDIDICIQGGAAFIRIGRQVGVAEVEPSGGRPWGPPRRPRAAGWRS